MVIRETADQLAKVLIAKLQQILTAPDDKYQLIAQSYDGASVMSGNSNGVQAFIRESFPYAYFIHCYAHQFNLLIKQAACAIKD